MRYLSCDGVPIHPSIHSSFMISFQQQLSFILKSDSFLDMLSNLVLAKATTILAALQGGTRKHK
jgi:hypothetical protein